MKDVLRPYVPEYKGQVNSDDGECILLQKNKTKTEKSINLSKKKSPCSCQLERRGGGSSSVSQPVANEDVPTARARLKLAGATSLLTQGMLL